MVMEEKKRERERACTCGRKEMDAFRRRRLFQLFSLARKARPIRAGGRVRCASVRVRPLGMMGCVLCRVRGARRALMKK